MNKQTVILAVLAGSMLPIWRDESWDGYVNTWEALIYTLTRSKEHVPYEEALAEAQQQWADYNGVSISGPGGIIPPYLA